jgi:CRISPR type III-B/RAMP module RAMP protein Cmr1
MFEQICPEGFEAFNLCGMGRRSLSSKGGELGCQLTSCKRLWKRSRPCFWVALTRVVQPELRAASFRGAMRFWLRALLGGVLGDRPDKIFQCESQVFGSTDHASPVVVRLEPHNLGSDGFNPLPHKQVTFRFNGFKPGQRFDICLLSRDEDALQQAQKALLLLCYLGGLGRRSRRGFGSLQITDGELALTATERRRIGECLKAATQRHLTLIVC